MAAVLPNNVRNTQGGFEEVQAVLTVDEDGNYAAGGGGGGGGDASAAKQDEQTALLTTIDADTSVLGAVGGAAVITDTNGTVQQYLRGLVARWASALGAGTAAAALRVTLASDGPGVAVLGATTGAAVVTDADGSLQQYLRGLVKQWIAGTLVIGAGANVIGKVDHSSTGIGHGVKVVATAGTDEALAGSTAAKWIILQAQTDNTGLIAVGATGVDATVATGNGVLLTAGDAVTLPIDNLADVFVDSTVSGDGVRYTYGT